MRTIVTLAALALWPGLAFAQAQPGQLGNQLPMRVGDVLSISATLAAAQGAPPCTIVTFADVPFAKRPNVLLTAASATASLVWVESRRVGLCVDGRSAGGPLEIYMVIQGAVPESTPATAAFHLTSTPVGSRDELVRLKSE
jgi:hypothetical protein